MPCPALRNRAWSRLQGAVLPKTSAVPGAIADLLQAIDDPKHERHAELKDWIGDDFDPKTVDTDRLAEELAALAKQWSRKPATTRARPA
jgi:Plasmid pRiA4b ORF-3-like protein